MSSPHLHSPLKQNFSCNSCGKCCVTPWKVKVAPERVPGIQSTERFGQLSKEGYLPLPVVDGEAQMGRREDGSCLFRHEKRCAIHSELGFQAKPVVCQTYPFSIINSPGGFYISLHFSCPSVLAGTGRPVEEHLPDLAQAISKSSFYTLEPMPADSQVALTHKKAIAWTEYLNLEPKIVAAIAAAHPVRDLLRLAIALSSPSLDLEAPLGKPEEIDLSLYPELVSGFALYTIECIATLEYPEDDTLRQATAQSLLENESTRSQILNGEMPPFHIRKSPDQLTEQIVDRYIKNFVLGKKLITDAPMITRLLMLAAAFATLFFYLDAKGRLQDERESEFDRLAWAFHLVEMCILSHNDSLTTLFLDFERELLAATERTS